MAAHLLTMYMHINKKNEPQEKKFNVLRSGERATLKYSAFNQWIWKFMIQYIPNQSNIVVSRSMLKRRKNLLFSKFKYLSPVKFQFT